MSVFDERPTELTLLGLNSLSLFPFLPSFPAFSPTRISSPGRWSFVTLSSLDLEVEKMPWVSLS